MINNLELIAILVADRQRAFFDYAESDRNGSDVRRRSVLRRLIERTRRRSRQVGTAVPTLDAVRRGPVSAEPSKHEPSERRHAA